MTNWTRTLNMKCPSYTETAIAMPTFYSDSNQGLKQGFSNIFVVVFRNDCWFSLEGITDLRDWIGEKRFADGAFQML